MPQHPASPDETDEDMSAEAVIARAIARRGEIFDEFRLLAQESPRTYDLISKTAGYMHHYTGAEGTKDERLGPGPRELIAIAALCARGEVEFAAQHIRRAYRYGLSKLQVLEAISCVLPMTGALTVQIGVRAMQRAEQKAEQAG